MKLIEVYKILLKEFGPQGWWPVYNKSTSGASKFSKSIGAWEMCVGAILTQNTAWKNVAKALDNLIKANSLDVNKIADMPLSKLQKLIKPSGFYKQKAKRLQSFAKFVLSFGCKPSQHVVSSSRCSMIPALGKPIKKVASGSVDKFCKNITREELLKQNGIGQETADSILLYACNKPYFVIEAYTRRIFTRLGLTPKGLTGNHKNDYALWRAFFERNLPQSIRIYKEYHALIVELAKRYCRKDSDCVRCLLNKKCKSSSNS